MEADVGSQLKVRVSFTDDRDNAESLTSEPTAPVQSETNTPAVGRPTISGTAQAGRTLTASTTGISDADGLTSPGYGYQWLRVVNGDDTGIGGADRRLLRS